MEVCENLPDFTNLHCININSYKFKQKDLNNHMIICAFGFSPFLTACPKHQKVSDEDISSVKTLRSMIAAFGFKLQ